MRDEMTDSQVGQALAEGWNYLAARVSARDAVKARVRNYIANNRTSYQSRTQHQIARLTKRLARKEMGRRT